MNAGPAAEDALGVPPLALAAMLVGLAGAWVLVLRWSSALVARLRPLAPEATSAQGALVFVVGGAAFLVTAPLLAWALGVAGEPPAMAPALRVQTGAALAGAALMLLLSRRLPGGAAALGLRPHAGPPAPLVGLATWLTFLPVFLAAGVVAAQVLGALGREPTPQGHIEAFLRDEAARGSPFVWLAITVVNPLCEELAFRGALYGGLRRRLPLPLAITVSAACFAASHELDVALQVGCLGLLLAWAYERSGSLAMPCVIHVLHNGLVLVMLLFMDPEWLT